MESRIRRSAPTSLPTNYPVSIMSPSSSPLSSSPRSKSLSKPTRSRAIVRFLQAIMAFSVIVALWQWYRLEPIQKSTLMDKVHLPRFRGQTTPHPVQEQHFEGAHDGAVQEDIVDQAPEATAMVNNKERFDSAKHSPDQQKVVDMIRWAWDAYEKYAYGHDSLNVRSYEGMRAENADTARTLIDSLDVLYLTGMFDEFDRASDWVAANVDAKFNQVGFVNVFETTIRAIGGLLTSYHLSGDKRMLEKADMIGEKLSYVFTEYPAGLPAREFDFYKRKSRDNPNLAEVGSLQLEYKYLARLTGKKEYWDYVEHISDLLIDEVNSKYTNGLLPSAVNIYAGRLSNDKVTMGARGDSYFEYLLKQWLLTSKTQNKYKEQYEIAVQGISDKMIGETEPNKYKFVGELVNGKLDPKMDHLVCFFPGLLALGYHHGMPEWHLDLAKELMETCYQMYAHMATGLAPEIVYLNTDEGSDRRDLYVKRNDDFNILRPETVESLMVLYRVTKDEKYREYGRNIRNAFEDNCRLDKGGYSSVHFVSEGPAQQFFRKDMESFFIAETLKYLFLLFDDNDIMSLDEYVFNTEAHPFPMSPYTFNP